MEEENQSLEEDIRARTKEHEAVGEQHQAYSENIKKLYELSETLKSSQSQRAITSEPRGQRNTRRMNAELE